VASLFSGQQIVTFGSKFVLNDANNNLLKRVENLWLQDSTWGPEKNPHITRTTTTLADVTPNLVTKQEFTYDQYNNQIDVDAPVAREASGCRCWCCAW